MWSVKGTNGAGLGIPYERVFSVPTSYAMESSGWYWKKKGETLRDVQTNCAKRVQESKQNLIWFETIGPVKSSVKSWRWWSPMSRSESTKLRRRNCPYCENITARYFLLFFIVECSFCSSFFSYKRNCFIWVYIRLAGPNFIAISMVD